MISFHGIEEVYQLRGWHEAWEDVDFEVKLDLYLAEYKHLSDEEQPSVWTSSDLINNPDDLARKKGVWLVLDESTVTEDLFQLAASGNPPEDLESFVLGLQARLIRSLFEYFDQIFSDIFHGDR
tara:strand:+ start:160 stop:531 length:372 start_codon:yes stop_codon:yes gene_type:complete